MMTTRDAACGAIAGAAGTTALNMATYLDMLARGRPPSSTPERTVDRLASLVGVEVRGTESQRAARTCALGALMGAMAGVGAGVAAAAVRGAVGPGPLRTLVGTFAVAMLVGNAPMTALGVTSPRTWSARDWAADVAPHAAYAVVATTAFQVTLGSRRH